MKSIMLAVVVAAASLTAGQARQFGQMTDAQIDAALSEIQKAPDLHVRIEQVSGHFLGTAYRLGPLGEGPEGEFDRDPLINLKEVDCTTLVEQVMAMSLATDLASAVRTLQKIRYKDGRIAYEARNHFTTADWIPNNAAAGYLKDVTREIGEGDTVTVSKNIRKRAWYAAKTEKDLEGFGDIPESEKIHRVRRLHAIGWQFPDETVKIDYVPVDKLEARLARIPSGTIANLIREDRDDMPDLVSHQILVIQKEGGTFTRHASSKGRVIDMPLMEYLHIYDGSKWRLLGLNFNQPLNPADR